MSSLNNSSVLHKPRHKRQACDYNIQAMQDTVLVIDNNVDPVYILLPNSELGKSSCRITGQQQSSCRIKVGELLLAGFQGDRKGAPLLYYVTANTRYACVVGAGLAPALITCPALA